MIAGSLMSLVRNWLSTIARRIDVKFWSLMSVPDADHLPPAVWSYWSLS
jgi:hypothetical protein